MTTDINDLDRYIGWYVCLVNGKDSAAGFMVNVADRIEYTPDPVRWISLDWGQGWPVYADTQITVVQPPEGEERPKVQNPIKVMHEAMHAGNPCSGRADCSLVAQAYSALKAFRKWQIKSGDEYWRHAYVRRAEAFVDCSTSVGEILFDARDEGAPPHILDEIRAIAERAEKEAP